MKTKLTFLFAILTFFTQSLPAQTWTQVGSGIDGEAMDDQSGHSVSLSSDGNTVAIGTPFNADNGFNSGHVRVFQNNNGSWTQIGSDIDGEAEEDWSGYSVSLSSDGRTLAVGAFLNDGNGSDAGHVRVFQNINGSWTQIGSDIEGEAEGDYSGHCVSLSSDGSIVAIGAHYNSDNEFKSGHVRVFQNINGSWTQIGSDIDGEAEGDWLGFSVSLSGDGSVVAIGAPEVESNGSKNGHVSVYKNINGNWTQIGSNIDGEGEGDYAGNSLSLSRDGSTVAVGSHRNDDNGSYSGHVRVYQNINGIWTQIGSDIDGKAEGDLSGYSVSLSSDGSIVAIGAIGNDDNFSSSGHVRIYKNINGDWIQLGPDIYGEAEDDNSGYSVSLSSDGGTVAIGSTEFDGNWSNSGHVRIFKLDWGASIESLNANNIYISPNPVSNMLTVNGITKSTEFQITDITGKEIFSGEISNNSVDVSTLNVGMYFLKLENQFIQFVKE